MRAARDRSRYSSRNLSGDKVRPVPITTGAVWTGGRAIMDWTGVSRAGGSAVRTFYITSLSSSALLFSLLRSHHSAYLIMRQPGLMSWFTRRAGVLQVPPVYILYTVAHELWCGLLVPPHWKIWIAKPRIVLSVDFLGAGLCRSGKIRTAVSWSRRLRHPVTWR
jgi:hypothetical protein